MPPQCYRSKDLCGWCGCLAWAGLVWLSGMGWPRHLAYRSVIGPDELHLATHALSTRANQIVQPGITRQPPSLQGVRGDAVSVSGISLD